jgi:hypothetical protein
VLVVVVVAVVVVFVVEVMEVIVVEVVVVEVVVAALVTVVVVVLALCGCVSGSSYNFSILLYWNNGLFGTLIFVLPLSLYGTRHRALW